MSWWGWVVFGLVLIAGEVVTPGTFFLLFFGVSAVLVGVITALSWADAIWLQWLLFSIFSIVSLVFFRKHLLKMVRPVGDRPDQSSVVGNEAVAITAIAAGGNGKVELRGTQWTALNVGTASINAHSRCKVVSVDGLTLRVEN